MFPGFQNFLTVLLKSLSGPTKVATLGIGVVGSLVVPQVTLLLLPISFVAVLSMAWTDLRDPQFIRGVLQPPQSTPSSLPDTIEALLQQIRNLRKDSVLNQEVTKDLDNVAQSLTKIKLTLEQISVADQGSVAFIEDFLPRIIQKLVKLSSQEQLARSYLERENLATIQADTANLKLQRQSTTDVIGQKEYDKAIRLKEDQYRIVQSMQIRLQRIDSYIARIKAVLEQSNAYLTKVILRDDEEVIDQGEILTESLRQVTAEIEDFADIGTTTTKLS